MTKLWKYGWARAGLTLDRDGDQWAMILIDRCCTRARALREGRRMVRLLNAGEAALTSDPSPPSEELGATGTDWRRDEPLNLKDLPMNSSSVARPDARDAKPKLRGEWLPIESAPRDGAPVILLGAAYTRPADEWNPETYFGPRVAIGQWNPEGTSWVDRYGSIDGAAHHLEATGTWSSEGGWFQPNEVTHWMPLPEPPRDQQVAGEGSRETI